MFVVIFILIFTLPSKKGEKGEKGERGELGPEAQMISGFDMSIGSLSESDNDISGLKLQNGIFQIIEGIFELSIDDIWNIGTQIVFFPVPNSDDKKLAITCQSGNTCGSCNNPTISEKSNYCQKLGNIILTRIQINDFIQEVYE